MVHLGKDSKREKGRGKEMGKMVVVGEKGERVEERGNDVQIWAWGICSDLPFG